MDTYQNMRINLSSYAVCFQDNLEVGDPKFLRNTVKQIRPCT
jgi:hypothetical protein